FVLEDDDRHALVDRLVALVDAALLAYCIMDNHIHLIVEGLADAIRADVTRALRAHALVFNARHGISGTLLAGPAELLAAHTLEELGRAIRYVHANPTKTEKPIVTDPVAFEWSSARAFAGLSQAPFPNTERARFLVGSHARWALPAPVVLEGVE